MDVAQKRKLILANVDEVAAEVRRLRKGYRKAGKWSLAQVCWHLNAVMVRTMAPGPHAAVEAGPEVRAGLAKILANGELPPVQAPERVVPAEEVGEVEVEGFLETLERFREFRGPFAPHRLFGEMGFEDYVRLHMIHCAHHLGFLVPADAG
jgi:hypothetical protein